MTAWHGEVRPSVNEPHIASSSETRAVLRDVKERGRDVEGCIKQWTNFVKPNFERYVEPQRKVAGEFFL